MLYKGQKGAAANQMTDNANGIEKEIKVKGHQLGTATRPSGLPKTILHSTVKEREGNVDRKRGRSDYPRTPQDTPGHSKIPQDAFNFLYNSFIYSFICSFRRKQSKNGILFFSFSGT